MSTAQLEGLWSYIQTLALSNRNKQWLEERLYQSRQAAEEDYYESPAFLRDIDSAEQDIAQGKGVVVTSLQDLDALFA